MARQPPRPVSLTDPRLLRPLTVAFVAMLCVSLAQITVGFFALDRLGLAPAEAARLAGTDPDYAQRDLFEAIERGDFPKWSVCIQVMSEAEAASRAENPFDVTKTWSQKEFPLIEVGELELNRNPQNYFAEVEQAAFGPSNMVPGVGLSPDRMLQGRVFAYADAHRYRVGTNHQQLPVNAPRSPVNTYQRDGSMAFGSNGGAAPNYEPNSYTEAPKQAPRYAEPALALSGAADRSDHREDTDYFSQPGNLFRLMTPAQQQALCVGQDHHAAGIPHLVKHELHDGPGVVQEFGLLRDRRLQRAGIDQWRAADQLHR